MNDRFKFRFYDNNKKIMIDENSDTEYIASIYGRDEWYWCIEAKMPKILGYFDGEGFVEGEWCKFNFAIMQCTGLKDKNDKLIYEGDILQDIARHDKPLYIVKWNKSQAQFYIEMINPKKYELYAEWHMGRHDLDYEVIGNIYENKELLESEG